MNDISPFIYIITLIVNEMKYLQCPSDHIPRTFDVEAPKLPSLEVSNRIIRIILQPGELSGLFLDNSFLTI
jgi:hypothetical protein